LSKSPIGLVAIDDDPGSLELIEDSLARSDLEIHTASNPEHGWSLIRRIHPEIVLLDLRMPKIGGMLLLEKVTNFDPPSMSSSSPATTPPNRPWKPSARAPASGSAFG
jgi:DNA-binding NtrC family response regulator